MKFDFDIEGGNFSKVGTASSELKKILKQLNVDSGVIRRTVVALYEAEVNVVAHAYSGNIKLDINSKYVDIKIEDKGPGIENLDLAMKEGYSTASAKVREMGFGAGMGLPNISENADEFRIESEVGKGTTLYINYNF